MKKCDIIIPVWNELESTRECINKLKNNTHYPCRLIVVDNGSLQPTKEYLESLKDVFPEYSLIRNNSNLGFVKAVNQGMKVASGAYVCLLNNDAYVTENWLKDLIETVEHGPEHIGIANPTSNIFGKNSSDGEKYQFQELDSCRGFCMLIRKELIEKIGIFDEIYGVGYFEEKDFSKRAIEAGYICIRGKSSFVFHKDKLSFDKIKDRDTIFKKNEHIYDTKWGKELNIAFITRGGNELGEKKNFIYNLLKKGHHIYIFFGKKRKTPFLKDHINIRYFPISEAFFSYVVIFKLWERLRKKKISFIITEENSDLKFFNKFKFVHKAEVKKSANFTIYDNSQDTSLINSYVRK